jgi:hypothetical protein
MMRRLSTQPMRLLLYRLLLYQSVGATALYTTMMVASGFRCDITFFCAPTRANVIAVRGAGRGERRVPALCIDETEALPYKPRH